MNRWVKVHYGEYELNYETYCEIKGEIQKAADARLTLWEIRKPLSEKFTSFEPGDHILKRELMDKLAKDTQSGGLWTGDDADSFCKKVFELVKRSKDADEYLLKWIDHVLLKIDSYEDHYREQLKRCEEKMGLLSQAQLWVDENIF